MKNEKLREQCEDIRQEFNLKSKKSTPNGNISRFQPLIGEVYFSVDEFIMPKACIWHNSKQDNLKIDNFNVYKTASDCEKGCKLIKCSLQVCDIIYNVKSKK